MPCAPAASAARAASTGSGSLPPRELRSTAILLTLTLSRVTRAVYRRDALPVVARRARLEHTLTPVERARLAALVAPAHAAREAELERAVGGAEPIVRATLQERR